MPGGVDFSKSNVICVAKCNVKHHLRLLNYTKLNQNLPLLPSSIYIMFPYSLQQATSGHANQELFNIYQNVTTFILELVL